MCFIKDLVCIFPQYFLHLLVFFFYLKVKPGRVFYILCCSGYFVKSFEFPKILYFSRLQPQEAAHVRQLIFIKDLAANLLTT